LTSHTCSYVIARSATNTPRITFGSHSVLLLYALHTACYMTLRCLFYTSVPKYVSNFSTQVMSRSVYGVHKMSV